MTIENFMEWYDIKYKVVIHVIVSEPKQKIKGTGWSLANIGIKIQSAAYSPWSEDKVALQFIAGIYWRRHLKSFGYWTNDDQELDFVMHLTWLHFIGKWIANLIMTL